MLSTIGKGLNERIKMIRIKMGMTMEEFGKLVLDANKSVVSKWEKGLTVPNNERLLRIAELGNISTEYLLSGNPFSELTREEVAAYEVAETKWQKKHWNIKQYQEKTHVRLEDFLTDSRRNFYISDHKLTNEDIKMLIALYGGKEKNYPSDEEIEKEYEEIKKKTC